MKRICLGKIVGAHGVKGLVKILPFGDDPRLIETLGPIFTGENSETTLNVTMKNSAGHKFWLASIEGVTERNGAEKLRGVELWTDQDKLPKMDDGRLYFADLIGLKAVDAEGIEIGDVIDVRNFGAGDLLEIRATKGTFMMPFTNDTCPEVNIKEGYILTPKISDYMELICDTRN